MLKIMLAYCINAYACSEKQHFGNFAAEFCKGVVECFFSLPPSSVYEQKKRTPFWKKRLLSKGRAARKQYLFLLFRQDFSCAVPVYERKKSSSQHSLVKPRET